MPQLSRLLPESRIRGRLLARLLARLLEKAAVVRASTEHAAARSRIEEGCSRDRPLRFRGSGSCARGEAAEGDDGFSCTSRGALCATSANPEVEGMAGHDPFMDLRLMVCENESPSFLCRRSIPDTPT